MEEAADIREVLLIKDIFVFFGVVIETDLIIFVGGVARDDNVLGVDVGEVDGGGVGWVGGVGH